MLSRGRLNQREDPSAARRALGKTFVQALMTNFERFGVRRLTRLRRQRPHLYFRLVTALLPDQRGGLLRHRRPGAAANARHAEGGDQGEEKQETGGAARN